MVVTPAGDPCIIAVPYQGTLNFASFFAPKKVREKRFFLFAPKKVREYSFPFPSRGERDDKEILLPAGKTLQKPSSVRRTSKILRKKKGRS